MGTSMQPLAIVQLNQLPDERKLALLDELFETLEYDHDSQPGSEWDSDTMQAIGETFNRYGIVFTDPDDLPNGYRFNAHKTAVNRFCRWSLVSVSEPMKRKNAGDLQCPNHCPGSLVEADPDAGSSSDGIIHFEDFLNIEDVVTALDIMNVPHTLHDARGGEWLLLVGAGEWDEAAERHTNPIQAGPVYTNGSARFASLNDFTYGPADGSFDHKSADSNDAEQIAADLAEMLARATGKTSS